MHMVVGVSIARNGRERTIAKFPYFNDDAEELIKRLGERNIPACVWFYSDCDGNILAWTHSYWDHCP